MSNEIDITGRRFGRLVAVQKNTAKRGHWIFKCDCGATHSTDKSSVMMGGTVSCGCKRRERCSTMAQRYGLEYATNMAGKRIGTFTVIEMLPVTGGGQGVMWKCKCDCGHEFEARGRLLRNKQVRHCPECGTSRPRISQTADMTGRKFGQLLVLGCIKSGGDRGRIMRCRCSCGKETEVPMKYLRSGNTKSCGCRKAKKLKQAHTVIRRNIRLYRESAAQVLTAP